MRVPFEPSRTTLSSALESSPVQTAIQLYSLRDLDEPLPDLLERVGRTSFAGVEFAGFGETPPGAVADALAATGLDVAAAHVGVDRLEDDFEEAVEACRAVDCDTVVVPYLDESHFADAAAVEATAETLAELADRLADVGLSLCYHNHDHEFVRVGEDAALELLVERTDDRVGFELDLGWALAAGADPAALLARFADRVPIVHLKDVDAESGTPVDLGEGDLDVDRCVAAARDANVEWLVYEHDDPDDPAATLARASERLATVSDD